MTDCNNCPDNIWDDDQEMEDTAEKEFTIKDDKACEWALKKVKQETEEHDRLVALAKAEIEELQEQIAKLDQALASKTGFFKSKMYEYFQTVERKSTKTQESYKLLSGSLVWKKPSQKMAPDKEKLLEYVKANNMPEYVKVKEDVDWAGLKKDCTIQGNQVINNQTGEVIDCIAVEDVPGEFGVKL